MENRNSFTIVGIFVSIVAVLIMAFVWWLVTKSDTNMEYKTYYIHTKTLPSGLKEGGSVKYMGVLAGYVKEIDFADGSNYGVIEISLDINKEFPIKKDSVAKVEVQGLGGLVSLNIQKGSIDFEKGEKPILRVQGGLLSKLNNEAENISDSINKTLRKLDEFLSDENIENLSKTLASIEEITAKLNNQENFNHINSILKSTDSILAGFDQNKTEFVNLLANFDELIQNSNTLAKTSTSTSKSVNKTLNLVNKSIEKGDYNIKEIMGSTLHETSLSLIELRKVLREFQGALFRLEDDPYDFFFKDTLRASDKGKK